MTKSWKRKIKSKCSAKTRYWCRKASGVKLIKKSQGEGGKTLVGINSIACHSPTLEAKNKEKQQKRFTSFYQLRVQARKQGENGSKESKKHDAGRKWFKTTTIWLKSTWLYYYHTHMQSWMKRFLLKQRSVSCWAGDGEWRRWSPEAEGATLLSNP